MRVRTSEEVFTQQKGPLTDWLGDGIARAFLVEESFLVSADL